jgi:hypothetical protein
VVSIPSAFDASTASSAASVSGRSSGVSPGSTSTRVMSSGSAASATSSASPVPRCSGWTTVATGRGMRASQRADLGLDVGPVRGDDDQHPFEAERRERTEDVAEERPARRACSTFGVTERKRVPRPAASTTAAVPGGR